MLVRLFRCLTPLIVVISFLSWPQATAVCGETAVAVNRTPPSTASTANTLPGWTVLIYLDGDNNLEKEAIDDFLEMAAVGSSADVNVIVQLDRIPGYDLRYGDWTGTLRFRVERGITPEPGNALADLGEANMGDPQTLVDFVAWGMSSFPARRTALILWNHGDGWRTSSLVKESRKAICWDDTNGRDALDSDELRQALALATNGGAAPLDLLAFDACLMAMIEIDSQIHPYVRVRVASEETEPGTGYPYDTILTHLEQDPGMDGAALGTLIVERYYEAYASETQSAIDLANAQENLVAAVDELAQALIDHGENEIGAVRDARRQVQQFQASYVDLRDLAALLIEETSSAALHQAAQRVIDGVEHAVLANRNGVYWPGAFGISIYFPAQPHLWDSQYAGESEYLVFTAETRWDEWLIGYLQLVESCDPDPYEPDNDAASAPSIVPGSKPQRHNFCPATDAADWMSISAQAGQQFAITTSELERNCDTVLRLLATDGETLLARDDDGGAGLASRLIWTSPAAGRYYIQVIEYYGRTGQDTGYTLNVEQIMPAILIDGTVTLQGRTAYGDTLVTVQPSGYATTTQINGTFALTATLPCTITAAHAGYLTHEWVVTETTATQLDLEPATLWGGDINADGQIDILDLAFIGAHFGSSDEQADINGDGVVDIRDLVLPAANFGRVGESSRISESSRDSMTQPR